ncbi:MAG: TIGR02611 family protein [Actinomycetes bacterium]
MRDTREGDSSTVLEEVAERLGFRGFLRRHRGLYLAYRALVAVAGFAIIVTGLVLIPLPGPGWLIVFAGLALLATEFVWAERLLNFARAKVRSWTDWVTRQSLAVRALIGLCGVALVVGAVALYLKVQGVPGWLPVIG